MNISQQASANLAALKVNAYPGRLVVAGLHASGEYLVQGCGMTGRSKPSRNRRYVALGGVVRPELVVPDPNFDPLTIYTAMGEWADYYVATNGAQTDTAIEYLRQGDSFDAAMEQRTFEPDKISTPRISALCGLRLAPHAHLSLIRKDPKTGAPRRTYYTYVGANLPPGVGWCLQTYQHDGDPPPSFEGPPYPLPLEGPMEALADDLWDALDKDNRVGLALKFIEIKSGKSSVTLRNKHDGD